MGAWHPQDTGVYLQREMYAIEGGARRNNPYNEFLMDGTKWDSGLPGVIDGFLAGTHENRESAAHAHRDFLSRRVLNTTREAEGFWRNPPRGPHDSHTRLTGTG